MGKLRPRNSKGFVQELRANADENSQASVLSSVLSHLNKNLKQRTLGPTMCHSSQRDLVIALRSWTDRVIPLRSRTDCVIALRSVLQLYVTALFYLENSRKIHPQGVRACQPKDAKRREWGEWTSVQERERPLDLWLLFSCFFLPPGPALCKSG